MYVPVFRAIVCIIALELPTASLRNWRILCKRREPRELPVMFPPGRERLATRPNSTRSLELKNTVGIDFVAFLTAEAASDPCAA